MKNNKNIRRRAYVENDGSFVRSKTISGYEPDSENSQQAIELARAKEQKKLTRKKRRRIFMAIVLIIAGLLLFAVSQVAVTIVGVEYNDSTINRSQDDEYIKTANQYLIDHPSERFSWARKNDLLAEFINKSHPEIGAAQIRGGFGIGKLYLEVRQPVAAWKTNSGTSFVDKEGVLFSRNYYNNSFITIEDRSSNGVISQRFLQFIGKIISGIDESGIGQIEKVVIPANSIRFVEVTLSGRNYPIKIQTDRDANSQVTDIVNMVNYLAKTGLTPTSYVDVRVKSRGFWK